MLAALVLAASSCGSAPGATAPAGWTCPATWVRYERGGCGPAAVLCAPGGGAAAGACDGVDVTTPSGLGGFRLAPGGALEGAWPAAEFAPETGSGPCPAGWSARTDGACDPGLRTDCPAGSEALPGGQCTPLDEARCPADPLAFPAAPPQAAGMPQLRVRAGADASVGDGSAARPFATLAAAMRALGARDGWILVGAGTYPESVFVSRWAVHVVGVCAARVRIEATTRTVMTVANAGALDLEGVTLRASAAMALEVVGAGQANVRSVRIDGAAGTAIHVTESGSRVEADGVEISGAVLSRTDPVGWGGWGAFVEDDADLVLTHVVLRDNVDTGAFALHTGRLAMSESVARRNGTAGGGEAAGVGAHLGGSIRVERSVLEGNRGAALLVADEDSRGEFADVVLRASLPVPGVGRTGNGLQVLRGASAQAARLLAEDNRAAGVLVGASEGATPTTLLLEATVVQRSQGLDGDAGWGVVVFDNASVQLRHAMVRDNIAAGVRVEGAHGHADVSDTVVQGTRLQTNGWQGEGLYAYQGSIHADRVLLVGNSEAGAIANGAGSLVELTDSVVRDTQSRGGMDSGEGLLIHAGGTLRAARVRVERNAEAGVQARNPGSVAELEDIAVLDTRPLADGTLGAGVLAVDTARVSIRRGLLQGNHDAAAAALPPVSVLELEDVIVRDVVPSTRGIGVGVAASGGAQVSARRLAVIDTHGAALASVPFGNTTQLGGARVEVTDAFIHVVGEGTVQYDPGRPLAAVGRAVSYGLHVGVGCTLTATQTVADGAGFGFYTSVGLLTLRTGLLSGNHRAGAVSSDAPGQGVLLQDVAMVGNDDDGIETDPSLPEVSLSRPPAPCTMPPCR